jgi:uncharacterized protein
MEKKYNNERKKVVKYLVLILVVLTSLNLLFIFLNQEKDIFSEIYLRTCPNQNTETNFLSNINGTLVELKVPAVNSAGKGVPTILSVESTLGTGKTLVSIENLLFWEDTQQSIRMARYVAGRTTGKNLNDFDLVYSVRVNNASLIGGPSAGAAIAIATIFALNSEKPNPNVIISGTINHDGTIGPVSEILEKAKAAKAANAELFLVPLSQSSDIDYDTSEHCQTFGTTEICSTETRTRKINVSQEAGIKVIEVESIEQALQYFRQ